MTATATATTLQDLPIADIRPHPDNPRRDVGDVTELADSIRSQGVVEPLVVVPHPDGGYTVVMGHRRRAAAELAGVDVVPALVRHDLDGRAKQIEAMLVENLHRADLTAVEEAVAYEQLQLIGYDIDRIATATGRSKATVRRRLQLMELPEGTRVKLHERQIPLEAADALLEFAGDAKAAAALERAAGTSNWDYELRHQRDVRERAATVARKVKELRAAGTTVVTITPKKFLYSYQFPANHTKCPGAAVYVDMFGRDSDICTTPDRHQKNTRTGATAETAEDELDKLAREEAAKTAASVRRDKLAGLLALKKLLPAAALFLAVEAIAGELYGDDTATFFEHVGRPGLDDDPDAARAWVQTLTDVQRVHLSVIVVAVSSIERDLCPAWVGVRAGVPPWPAGPRLDSYIALLTELGWQASDIEKELIAAGRTAADRTAAAS